ncbi:MAG: signal peptidase I, partial [Cellulomonadaceae bacterium]
ARSGRARRSRPSALREVAIIFVSALVLSWVVKTFLAQPFYIPSISMEDTLLVGDRVIVSKLAPGPFDLHHGDVIVFKDPGGWLEDTPEPTGLQRVVAPALRFVGLLPEDSGSHLIKRAIGLPGDRVACCTTDGTLTVNGTAIDESPYIKPGSAPSQVEFDVVVPQDSLWVMGDNRQHSHDSRFTGGLPGGGFVPLDDVVGVALLKVWPLDRVSVMRNPADVFEEVPEP